MKKVLLCKEEDSLETRVALILDDIKKLKNMGFEFKVVKGAGINSGFSDESYVNAGAVIVDSDKDGYSDSEIVVRILKPSNIDDLKEGTLHLSYLDPFNEKDLLNKFVEKKAMAVSLEKIGRAHV